jgi:hypothetical protein
MLQSGQFYFNVKKVGPGRENSPKSSGSGSTTMQRTAVCVFTLSEVFGTEMLGGLPPLVEELDDRLVQWRA